MGAHHGESVGVVVLTHLSRAHLSRCLPPIVGSTIRPRVLVVDTSSNDGTVAEAKRCGAEALVISPADFNHGTTREMARKYLNTDIVVMVSPDAYAQDDSMLGRLIAPLVSGQASLAYGRQLPHEGASILESFHRYFNYGDNSRLRGLEDVDEMRVATFFCSDAWAAYRSAHLDDIGGFVPVLRGEDHVAAATLLNRGYRIAYVAEAVARHSHQTSLRGEFAHYFGVGYVMVEHRDLFSGMGGMDRRGHEYAKMLALMLLRRAPHLLPYAALRLIVKWLGYHTGRMSLNAPVCVKRVLSDSTYYWKSGVDRRKEGD